MMNIQLLTFGGSPIIIKMQEGYRDWPDRAISL